MSCGATWVQKRPIWLWWAIDRTSCRILGWALGDRDTRAARALGAQIPQGPHIQYCTDHWRCYAAIFPAGQHTQGKAHTHIIESMNNKLRCYLARLRLQDALLLQERAQPARLAAVCVAAQVRPRAGAPGRRDHMPAALGC
ncbi:MAG: IS1 family transposase [Ottowia sp.]|nr:IS1 family transposase [Ottowia sp.]